MANYTFDATKKLTLRELRESIAAVEGKEAKDTKKGTDAPLLRGPPQQPSKLNPVAWVQRFGSALARGESGRLEEAIAPGKWLISQDKSFASVKAFTNNLIYSVCRRDQSIYLELFREAIKMVDQGLLTQQDVERLCKRSGDVLASSGSSPGICARLVAGFERRCIIKPITRDECRQVYDLFKIAELRDISKEGIGLVDDFIEINETADSGLPWPGAKTKETMVFHTKLMNELWGWARSGVLTKQLDSSENLWMTTCLLKNKLEIYEIDEFLSKTRPYYVFPNGLKWLMMSSAKPLQDALIDLTNPLGKGSYSAYHFSWTPRGDGQGGGASALVQIIMESSDGELHGCAYGDDQFWWYKVGDHLWLWVPDNKMMDMSVDAQLTDPVSAVLCSMCGDKRARKYLNLDEASDKLGPTWSQFFLLNISLALRHRTLLEGSLPAVLNRLASGIPLTTVVDMVVSCFGFVRVKRHFESLIKRKNLGPKEAMDQCWADMETVGLRVKEETRVCYSTLAGDEKVGADALPRFLGMVIRTDGKQYWPEPLRERIWQTLVNPRSTVGDRTALLLGRYFNITLCGGYCFPEVYAACKLRWEREAGHTKPAVTEVGVGFESINEAFSPVTSTGTAAEFPSPQALRAFYALGVKPSTGPAVEGGAEPMPADRLRTGARPSWADMVEEEEESERSAATDTKGKGKSTDADSHLPPQAASQAEMDLPVPSEPRLHVTHIRPILSRPGQLGETKKGKARRLDLEADIRARELEREQRLRNKRKEAAKKAQPGFKKKARGPGEKSESALARFETPPSSGPPSDDDM